MKARRIWGGVLAIAAALLLVGCGDGASPSAEANAQAGAGSGDNSATTADGLTVPAAMRAFSNDGNIFEVRIEGTDQMTYSVDEFTVAPGQMVRLTLEHVGSLPAAAMGHNVVIIERGEDYMEFAADANEQGANHDNEFVPEPVRERVIAHTEMIGGGESTTVEFKAPEQTGDYPFLCTFPGHAAQMNGMMTVQQ